jgi:hypothetical protein
MATDEEKRAYLNANGDADLNFLLEEAEMTLDHQYQLILAGFKTPKKIQYIADSLAAARVAFTQLLTIDAATAAGRLALSACLEVWESCGKISTKTLELRAENRANGNIRILSQTERGAMKRIIEVTNGKMAQADTPAASYLSEKMQEIEDNEPFASRLDEVLSLEDHDIQTLTTAIDPAGRIVVTKKKGKIGLPQTTEEFRTRLKVEMNTWLLLATKFSNRTWLRNLVSRTWLDYTEYFLGNKVNQLPQASPAWTVVLEYEYECRKEAFRRVREDAASLNEALKAVCKESELRDLHFIMPLTVSRPRSSTTPPPKRVAPDHVPDTPPPTKVPRKAHAKGSGKGGNKGTKGKPEKKDRSVPAGNGWIRRTPDGRDLCYFYFQGRPCNGSCGMVHGCRIPGCGEPHTLRQHLDANPGAASR